MRCIRYDLRRAIAGRWFLLSLFATAATMWLADVNEANYLMDALNTGEGLNVFDFFQSALTGQLGMLVLPALSALPYAAEALHELRSGAARAAIFRTGRSVYVLGQALACAVSGMAVQGMGFTVLVLLTQGALLLHGLGAEAFAALPEVMPPLLTRMFCGTLWACVGCTASLLTETAGAACLAPLCLCYALRMLGVRYFSDVLCLDPMNWPTLPGGFVLLATLFTVVLTVFTLAREVQKYV